MKHALGMPITVDPTFSLALQAARERHDTEKAGLNDKHSECIRGGSFRATPGDVVHTLSILNRAIENAPGNQISFMQEAMEHMQNRGASVAVESTARAIHHVLLRESFNLIGKAANTQEFGKAVAVFYLQQSATRLIANNFARLGFPLAVSEYSAKLDSFTGASLQYAFLKILDFSDNHPRGEENPPAAPS